MIRIKIYQLDLILSLAECNLALTGQVSVAAMSRLKHAAVSIRSDAEIDLNFLEGVLDIARLMENNMHFRLALRQVP